MASLTKRLATAALFLIFATGVRAQVLTFEGLKDLEVIGSYYNGGTGSLGSGPGPSFGITFSPTSQAIIEVAAGGNGNFANEPSRVTTMFFHTGTAVMNVPGGFTGGFSFFYSANIPASVIVYDGVNATGNVLASINLVANTPANNCQVGLIAFCNWSPGGASFSGTARSIDFGGTVDRVGYDNITIGSGTPSGSVPGNPSVVPALDSFGLVSLAALAAILGLIALRRRSV